MCNLIKSLLKLYIYLHANSYTEYLSVLIRDVSENLSQETERLETEKFHDLCRIFNCLCFVYYCNSVTGTEP